MHINKFMASAEMIAKEKNNSYKNHPSKQTKKPTLLVFSLALKNSHRYLTQNKFEVNSP